MDANDDCLEQVYQPMYSMRTPSGKLERSGVDVQTQVRR